MTSADLDAAHSQPVSPPLTPRGFRDLVDVAFASCQEKATKNPMPPSLAGLFNKAAAHRSVENDREILFSILPVKQGASDDFFDALSDKDRLALGLFAYTMDNHDDCDRLVDGIIPDERIHGYMESMLFEMRNGYSQKIGSLARKAASFVMNSFTTEDLEMLDERQQGMLVELAGYTYEYSDYDGQALQEHAKLVSALHIPADAVDLHMDKARRFQHMIMTDEQAFSLYSQMFDYGIFKDAKENWRMMAARQHIRHMAELYEIPALEIDTFDEEAVDNGNGGKRFAAMRLSAKYSHPTFSRDITKVELTLLMNEGVEGKGLHEIFGSEFVDSLSHEFAHYVEIVLAQMALNGEAYDILDPSFPLVEGVGRHFGHARGIETHRYFSAARTFAFNGASFVSTKRYIEAETDDDAYLQQVRERHARWVGKLFATMAREACEARKYISAPGKYRDGLCNTLSFHNDKLKPYHAITMDVVRQVNRLSADLKAAPDDAFAMAQILQSRLPEILENVADLLSDDGLPLSTHSELTDMQRSMLNKLEEASVIDLAKVPLARTSQHRLPLTTARPHISDVIAALYRRDAFARL